MRTPIPGILPPGSIVKITPSPPLGANEVLTLGTRDQPNGEKAATAERDGGSIILRNLTTHYVPYMLGIADKRTHISVAWLLEHARNLFFRQGPSQP